MKVILEHWSVTTPNSNVITITPTMLRVKNDDKVVYTLYKADVNIEVITSNEFTDITITDFKHIKIK